MNKASRKAVNQHAWRLAMLVFDHYRVELAKAVASGEADARNVERMLPSQAWPALKMTDAADAWIEFPS